MLRSACFPEGLKIFDNVLQLWDCPLNLRVCENAHANAVAHHGSNKCSNYCYYPECSKVDLSALKETFTVLFEELGDIPRIIRSIGGLFHRADKETCQNGGWWSAWYHVEQVFDLDAIVIDLICFLILFNVLFFEGIFVSVEFHVVNNYGGNNASDAPALDRQDVVRVTFLGACILLPLW